MIRQTANRIGLCQACSSRCQCPPPTHTHKCSEKRKCQGCFQGTMEEKQCLQCIRPLGLREFKTHKIRTLQSCFQCARTLSFGIQIDKYEYRREDESFSEKLESVLCAGSTSIEGKRPRRQCSFQLTVLNTHMILRLVSFATNTQSRLLHGLRFPFIQSTFQKLTISMHFHTGPFITLLHVENRGLDVGKERIALKTQWLIDFRLSIASEWILFGS